MSCQICESQKVINVMDFQLSIYKDDMEISCTANKSGVVNVFIQISFCPFCGTKLKGENE